RKATKLPPKPTRRQAKRAEAAYQLRGTHRRGGLKVKAVLDTNQYETGVEVSKEDIDQLRLKRHKVHPAWNYTLLPRTWIHVVASSSPIVQFIV
ncbi:MAG: hypothetical protein LAP87_23505, partial [Acidobacteriia bacterium]|nr:hypothetical protein [Terriglobia bacterium]